MWLFIVNSMRRKSKLLQTNALSSKFQAEVSDIESSEPWFEFLGNIIEENLLESFLSSIHFLHHAILYSVIIYSQSVMCIICIWNKIVSRISMKIFWFNEWRNFTKYFSVSNSKEAGVAIDRLYVNVFEKLLIRRWTRLLSYLNW